MSMGSVHRACSGLEHGHDGNPSLQHGCCVLCVTPWPCAAELVLQAARIRAIEGDPDVKDARYGDEPERHRHDWVQYTLENGAILATCSFCGHGTQLR
jgi:hypothetical protein